jgi:hypothetical protein
MIEFVVRRFLTSLRIVDDVPLPGAIYWKQIIKVA